MVRFSLAAYFSVAFTISAVTLAILGLPRLTPGGTPNPTALAMFPVMVVTVGAAGVVFTAVGGGRQALRDLWSRMRLWKVSPWWYATLLFPPIGIMATLAALRQGVSPGFAPGLLAFGIPIGLVAGFFEEIGWTGYAYPRMWRRFGAVRAALLLGALWGLWHLPVVDSLGAASPHGPAWPAFFAAFVALVAAVRCAICWTYTRTGSVLLAQLMHASSTGFLVVFSAPHVTAWQEATWYAAYAGLLWIGVLTTFVTYSLGRKPANSAA
jgi:membrane protease YdiL (CAAX protease family)